MLIAVVIVFLLCQVPSIVDNIFMATLSDDMLQSPPLVKLTCIASLMVITNSAANFYLYCVFGHKFRRTFVRIFCVCYVLHNSTKAFLEHETSLLRGSSVAQREGSCNNGTLRMNVHVGGGSSLDRKGGKSGQCSPATYRYGGKSLKISVGGGGSKLIKTSNGQARYTSIKVADDAPETNLWKKTGRASIAWWRWNLLVIWVLTELDCYTHPDLQMYMWLDDMYWFVTVWDSWIHTKGLNWICGTVTSWMSVVWLRRKKRSGRLCSIVMLWQRGLWVCSYKCMPAPASHTTVQKESWMS